MFAKKDIWTSIRPEELRVGHYIKINHRWFDHPFVRKIFMISSADEIAIIHNAGLKRLLVDLEKSELGPRAAVPESGEEGRPVDAEVYAKLRNDKDAHCAEVAGRRDQLGEVRERYRTSVKRAHSIIGLLNASDPTSALEIGALADGVLETVQDESAPLALVASAAPLNLRQRNALLSIDAANLVGVIGRRLGMHGGDLRSLIMGATMHLTGLQRLPPGIAQEDAGSNGSAGAEFRHYPMLSARIAEACGGFSGEVLRIIREHRERPDGSGFPSGLVAEDTHPSATILSMVREFQLYCSAEKFSPAMAVSYMYRHLRGVFGDKMIQSLVTCLTVYPPGTFVLLTDGSIARVLRTNADSRMRPVVGLIDDESSEGDREIIDLSQEGGLGIAEFVNVTMVPRQLVDQEQGAWVGVAVSQHQAAA